MPEVPQERPRTPVVFVAQLQHVGSILLITIGLLLPPITLWLIINDASNSIQGAGYLSTTILSPIFILTGIGRLVRGKRSDWAALAIDSSGIYFGAQPGLDPARFSWDEVSALLMFKRRTDFIQGSISCIGVRVHPCSRDSPESFLRELQRQRARADLSEHEHQQLNRLAAELSDFDPEIAVSFHTEARGWGYTRPRLREAMRTHAPGVPVIELSSDAYFDLVGWRDSRERLQRIVEDTELDKW